MLGGSKPGVRSGSVRLRQCDLRMNRLVCHGLDRLWTEVFRSPMAKQEETSGKGIEHTALSNEHGYREAFPGDIVTGLIIVPFVFPEPLEAGHASIEKKTSDGERSTPAVEPITKGGRRSQPDHDKAADNAAIKAEKESVEKVNAGRVP